MSEQPHRCQTCSSTSCCVTWSPPEIVPLETGVTDINEHIAVMMDDPETVWFWQLVHGSATRARVCVKAHTRRNDD